ncbi:mas1, partial [Symbiodinium necroappetens]
MTPDARIVLVSGASRGIGLSVAETLLAEGYRVSAGARDTAATQSRLGEHPRLLVCRYDAQDPDSQRAWVERTVATWGGIDALVNNAGIAEPFAIEDEDEAVLDRLFAVNVKAPLRLTRLCLPHLRASGRGRVINVTKIDREAMIDPEDLGRSVAYLLALPNSASVAELLVNCRLEGPRLRFRLDGRAVEGAAGDSLLTAILLNGRVLRRAEFGGGHRAGFCLMGACQDCYVQLDDGRRLRACQTPLEAGMSVRTTAGTHAPRIVIVGAGPAGVRAAERLVAAGLRPSVIDEGQAAGGQIYKQPAPHHAADGATLYGSEAGKAAALHARFAALRGRIDYRAKTLVWDAVPGRLHLQDLAAGGTGALDWSHLILATGAMDRVMPLPGWTLPGVFTLGGAQSLLKTQGCLIGRRTGFVGTGPLLYWVAVQYARAGADIAAVLDTTGFGRQLAKGVGLLGAPDFLRRGLAFVSELKRRGVPVYRGITAPEVLGEREVAGLSFRHGGQRLELACDAVALGHGLRSEIALADLLDLPFAYRRDQQQWTPRRDAAGRTPMPG